MTRAVQVALAATLLVACAQTPEKAFKELQSASCDGDVPGAFRHIDKTKMAENFSERMAAESEKQGGLAAAMAPMLAKKAAADAMTEWEDNIKRGKESDFCKSTYESSDAQTGRVSWTTPTGKSKTGYFEKAGDSWLLTSVEDR